MHYTYVLLSKKDQDFFIGYTNDLKNRFKEHNNGEVESTKPRRPFEIVYYESCINEKDAIKREKYFKTGFGRRFLNNRLENYLAQARDLSDTQVKREARDGGRGAKNKK